MSRVYADARALEEAGAKRRRTLEAGSGDAARARMLVVTWSGSTDGGRVVEVAVTTPASQREDASRLGRTILESLVDAPS